MADIKRLLITLIRIHAHFYILQIFQDSIESKDINLRINKKTRILKYKKLKEFIVNELNNKQSLKAITGRNKIAYQMVKLNNQYQL